MKYFILMNRALLIKSISEKDYNLNFVSDAISRTWGISYVRLVVGRKTSFKHFEHFFIV